MMPGSEQPLGSSGFHCVALRAAGGPVPGFAEWRDHKNGKFRNRRDEALFIDARKVGRMVERTHRELADTEIEGVAGAYHA